MDLVFVESFYWVATLKSVSRAAKRVHISQSAMSSRIRVLEAELGTPLLGGRVGTRRRRFPYPPALARRSIVGFHRRRGRERRPASAPQAFISKKSMS